MKLQLSDCGTDCFIYFIQTEWEKTDSILTGRQSDKQSPSVMVLWSPCLIILQTEADLQQAQAQSAYCQDPRGVVGSSTELWSEATLSLVHIYSLALCLLPSVHLQHCLWASF